MLYHHLTVFGNGKYSDIMAKCRMISSDYTYSRNSFTNSHAHEYTAQHRQKTYPNTKSSLYPSFIDVTILQ